MQAAFFIRMNGRFQSIPFDSILYISSKRNYCEINTISKKKYLTYGSISYVEEKLPENLFCRVHRCYVVSIGKIEAFDHNHLFLGEEKLPISKEGFERVLERIVLICPEYNKKLNGEFDKMHPEEYLKEFRGTKEGE
jgi:DNA-binding LytR/AlgR family response regulator